MYELLCQAEDKLVLCHTTDLRVIQPLEGTKSPPVYIVQFQCPRDRTFSVNLCSSGHLDLVYYSDPRLELLSKPMRRQFLAILLERLQRTQSLTYEDFLKEMGA